MSKKELLECDGKPCLYPKAMKKWYKALDDFAKSDECYPDPIDNSPCDHCEKTKENDFEEDYDLQRLSMRDLIKKDLRDLS